MSLITPERKPIDVTVDRLRAGDYLPATTKTIVSVHRSSARGKTIVVVANKYGTSHAATWNSRTTIRVERAL